MHKEQTMPGGKTAAEKRKEKFYIISVYLHKSFLLNGRNCMLLIILKILVVPKVLEMLNKISTKRLLR